MTNENNFENNFENIFKNVFSSEVMNEIGGNAKSENKNILNKYVEMEMYEDYPGEYDESNYEPNYDFEYDDIRTNYSDYNLHLGGRVSKTSKSKTLVKNTVSDIESKNSTTDKNFRTVNAPTIMYEIDMKAFRNVGKGELKLKPVSKSLRLGTIVDLADYYDCFGNEKNNVNAKSLMDRMKKRYSHINLILHLTYLFGGKRNDFYGDYSYPVVLEFTLPKNFKYYQETNKQKDKKKKIHEIKPGTGVIMKIIGFDTLVVNTSDIELTNIYEIVTKNELEKNKLVAHKTMDETLKMAIKKSAPKSSEDIKEIINAIEKMTDSDVLINDD